MQDLKSGVRLRSQISPNCVVKVDLMSEDFGNFDLTVAGIDLHRTLSPTTPSLSDVRTFDQSQDVDSFLDDCDDCELEEIDFLQKSTLKKKQRTDESEKRKSKLKKKYDGQNRKSVFSDPVVKDFSNVRKSDNELKSLFKTFHSVPDSFAEMSDNETFMDENQKIADQMENGMQYTSIKINCDDDGKIQSRKETQVILEKPKSQIHEKVESFSSESREGAEKDSSKPLQTLENQVPRNKKFLSFDLSRFTRQSEESKKRMARIYSAFK